MNLGFSIEEAVKTRYSTRTYTDQLISDELIDKINEYINTLSNPFSVKVNFKLLEANTSKNTEKLGTYGVIKGAKHYIGATIENSELALEALGYEFEKLILYLTSLGLGTCWLGGTFNRNSFKNAFEVKETEIFPAISPLGYPSNKKRIADSLVRMVAGSDHRKPWSDLFYNNNFTNLLSSNDAGAYAFPLEMIRLAPSASNKQPWRIVKDGTTYHFYEFQAKGYSTSFGYDIQKVDIGIAACHFHLAALEKDLKGEFKKLQTPTIDMPEQIEYIFSWICA